MVPLRGGSGAAAPAVAGRGRLPASHVSTGSPGAAGVCPRGRQPGCLPPHCLAFYFARRGQACAGGDRWGQALPCLAAALHANLILATWRQAGSRMYGVAGLRLTWAWSALPSLFPARGEVRGLCCQPPRASWAGPPELALQCVPCAASCRVQIVSTRRSRPRRRMCAHRSCQVGP